MQFLDLKNKPINKEILIFLLGTIFILNSSGCKNEEIDMIVRKDERYEEVQKINDDNLEYETLMYNENNIEIFYPRLKNISEIGTILNDILYNKVVNISEDNKMKKMSRINFKISYYDRETLSILFYGIEEGLDGKNKDYINDFNYNLPKNISIDFKDYFGNYTDDLIRKFESKFGIKLNGGEQIYFEDIDNLKYVVLYSKKRIDDEKYEKKYLLDKKVKRELVGNFE